MKCQCSDHWCLNARKYLVPFSNVYVYISDQQMQTSYSLFLCVVLDVTTWLLSRRMPVGGHRQRSTAWQMFSPTQRTATRGGRLGKISKWEAAGRVKLLVGGGKQGNNWSGRWDVVPICLPPGYDSLIEICTKSCFRELSVVFDHIHILGVNVSHTVGFTISSSSLCRLFFCLSDLPVLDLYSRTIGWTKHRLIAPS